MFPGDGLNVRRLPDKRRFVFYWLKALLLGGLGYGFIWIQQTQAGVYVLPPEIGLLSGAMISWGQDAFREWGVF